MSATPETKIRRGTRKLGLNPRALGVNPTALGLNPRALGENPKAKAKRAKYRKRAERLGVPESFYCTEEWRQLRYRVLSRSDGRCALCGRSKPEHGVTLHVDHIKPRSRFPSLAMVESNLQVLCDDCNMGKGATDTRDWRP